MWRYRKLVLPPKRRSLGYRLLALGMIGGGACGSPRTAQALLRRPSTIGKVVGGAPCGASTVRVRLTPALAGTPTAALEAGPEKPEHGHRGGSNAA
jgi:hypothetical protein